VYGIAGNVIHDAIEHYINTEQDIFERLWSEANIESKPGLNNTILRKLTYQKMMDDGMKYIDTMKSQGKFTLEAERRVEFEFMGVKIKGFYDLIAESPFVDMIIDWKTNSKSNTMMHRDQRLFYSWMHWHTTGNIPVCEWVYLRGKSISERFTIREINEFQKELERVITEIRSRDEDISKYPMGDFTGPFNNYLHLCHEENARRIANSRIKILFEIKGNFVFITTDDARLIQGIDFATKFDLPEKHFMMQAAKQKGYKTTDAGTIHLMNVRRKCFPIGMMPKVKEIIKEYAEHYKKEVQLRMLDFRSKQVMEWKSNISGDYVWAVEPCNSTFEGRKVMEEKNILEILKPFEKRCFDIDICLIDNFKESE
jgi:hypothetical protein